MYVSDVEETRRGNNVVIRNPIGQEKKDKEMQDQKAIWRRLLEEQSQGNCKKKKDNVQAQQVRSTHFNL